MGIMGKLAFWKKDDDFGEEPRDDLNMEKHFRQELGGDDNLNPFEDRQQAPNFDPGKPYEVKSVSNPAQPPTNGNSDMINKNIEIVSAKIDALKSELESMNQRIMNIEAIARKEQTQDSNRRYPQW